MRNRVAHDDWMTCCRATRRLLRTSDGGTRRRGTTRRSLTFTASQRKGGTKPRKPCRIGKMRNRAAHDFGPETTDFGPATATSHSLSRPHSHGGSREHRSLRFSFLSLGVQHFSFVSV
ncbi:hypothetical protein E2542_SST10401 [Spatholobus suberectus]|nr:hypothetical protein E2542_SST10401 [Spatholobus suberectus]